MASYNSRHTIAAKWHGLRLGVLTYRLFLHHYILHKYPDYNGDISNYLDDIKPKQLGSIFNITKSYSIPIYHDVYLYNKTDTDKVWNMLLKANTPVESIAIDNQTILESDFELLTIRKTKTGSFEIVNGANTFIILSLYLHVLNEFSENNTTTLFKSLRIDTKLNEQKIFKTLLRNGINKQARTAEEISNIMPYNFSAYALNSGYHFMETMFRIVYLIQESKIPQSDNYIPDLDVFINNILKNITIKTKELTHDNYDKTFLNYQDHLARIVLEWL